MRSLSRRLTVSLAGSLAAFFLFLVIVFGIEIESLSEKTVLSRMEHDMENLLASMQVQKGVILLEHSKIDAIYERPLSGHYYQLKMGQRVIRSRSLWDESLPSIRMGIQRDVKGPKGQHLLLYTREFQFADTSVDVTIAEDMTELYHYSSVYQHRLLLIFVMALSVLLGLQVWVIRRGLQPLGQVRRALRKLEGGETQQLKLDLPSEIEPLVEEVNRLLLVMQERMARSRAATGNLAHALKTPLAVIRRTLESGQEDGGSQQIAEQTEKIQQLIERELSRARLAGGAPGGFWPAPAHDVRDLTGMLQKVYGDKLSIRVNVAANIHVVADREDMLELIGNLLDNACKWARSQVECSLQVISGQLVLRVEDDGPGMPEHMWQAMVQRGMRSDESKPGHGLGLAIVQDIVDAYKGEMMSCPPSSLGGLCVEVRLPLRWR